jgi:dihydrofolate reductase
MGIIAADLFITLDGVYQAPGGSDEDRAGGFEFGGWQAPFTDRAIGASIMASIERTDALLLGRRTYDIFASYWPFQPTADNPVAAKFAAIPKYVVSRTLENPSWADTTVLRDAAEVGRLRDEFGEVHTWGSGELLRTLLAQGLLDRLNLWMYPIAIGTGKRLFDSAVPTTFRPAQPAQLFDAGVMALVLEPAGGVETGEVGADPEA